MEISDLASEYKECFEVKHIPELNANFAQVADEHLTNTKVTDLLRATNTVTTGRFRLDFVHTALDRLADGEEESNDAVFAESMELLDWLKDNPARSAYCEEYRKSADDIWNMMEQGYLAEREEVFSQVKAFLEEVLPYQKEAEATEYVRSFDRERCQEILERYGFEVYDNETVGELREAIAANIQDGTIKMEDI